MDDDHDGDNANDTHSMIAKAHFDFRQVKGKFDIGLRIFCST